MNFEDKSKLISTSYKDASFGGDLTLDYERAQSPDSELWLFQFPPQITTEDFSKSGLQIPTRTKLTQAGKNVTIGTFTVHGVRYVLSEAPADSVANMVNFWSSDEDMDQGIVYRGKPFHRLFIANIDVASNLTGTRQIIDSMPMGMNKPFEVKPIILPKGLDNPWSGGKTTSGRAKSANILKQLENAPFHFTSGNFEKTMSENKKWIGDADVFENHYTKPVDLIKKVTDSHTAKPTTQVKQQITTDTQKDKKDTKKEKDNDKNDKSEKKIAVKQEQNETKSKKQDQQQDQQNTQKQKRSAVSEVIPTEEISPTTKKQKNAASRDGQELVQLGGKKDKKAKKDQKQ